MGRLIHRIDITDTLCFFDVILCSTLSLSAYFEEMTDMVLDMEDPAEEVFVNLRKGR